MAGNYKEILLKTRKTLDLTSSLGHEVTFNRLWVGLNDATQAIGSIKQVGDHARSEGPARSRQ
jgi:hypothetical protein